MANLFSVQSIPEDDTAYRTDTYRAGVWGYYEMKWRYRTRTHVEQLPTAAPAGGGRGRASIVKWADDTMQVKVQWSAERHGAWPVVPHPDVADDNLTLLEAQIIPMSPPLSPDGKQGDFKIMGEYLFAVTDPDKVVFQAGLMPWIQASFGRETYIPREVFQHGIIDRVPGGGGGAANGDNLFPG